MKSIKVNTIKLTSSTKKITGFETIQELNQGKSELFKNYSDSKLLETIINLYNNKLKDHEFEKIKELSTEAKIEHAISILTLTLELNQDVDKAKEINALSLFMNTRININNSSSTKYVWQTVTYGNAFGLKEGMNFSEFMEDSNIFAYLLRTTSFEPEIRDGLIISSPKRTSKGGDILTKDGKLLFQKTNLVLLPIEDVSYSDLYNQYKEIEQSNSNEFMHDKFGSISASEVPEELRTEGQFNVEFQEWLNNYVGTTLNLHTSIETVQV